MMFFMSKLLNPGEGFIQNKNFKRILRPGHENLIVSESTF